MKLILCPESTTDTLIQFQIGAAGMNLGTPIIFDNYSFSGDISVIAICVVIIILLLTSYVSRTRSFNIFMAIIVQLIFAASVNIAYHMLLQRNIPSTYNLIYILRLVYYGLLFDVLFLFTLYTTVVSGMDHSQARFVAVISSLLFVVIMGIDIVRTLIGVGFQISPEGKVLHRTNLYVIGYIAYIILLAALMNRASKLLYKRVMYGFYGTMLVSVLIRLGQLPFGQSSLTTITFVFPVIAMLYIMHSNPYNVSLGTVDTRALEEMVREMERRDESFIYMSLLLPEFDEEGKELPEEISSLVR